MSRMLLLVPPLLSLLLCAGCQSEADKRKAEAVELTSQAQQAIRRGTPQDMAEAKLAIDKAIAIEPTGHRYWLLAETQMNDNLPAALDALDKGLAIDPHNNRLLRWKESVEKASRTSPPTATRTPNVCRKPSAACTWTSPVPTADRAR